MSTYPRRSIRIPDNLWETSRDLAHRSGTDVSTLVRGFLHGITGLPADEPATRIDEQSTPAK